MKFELRKFSEEEIREYNVIDSDNKYAPEGGIADMENDVRLLFYKKKIVMEPDNRYCFIFDYKGIAISITIKEYAEGNNIIYDLVGTDKLLNEEERKNLREAVKVYGNRIFYVTGRKDKSDKIIINF